MKPLIRVSSWRTTLLSLVVLSAAGGIACFQRVESESGSRMSITAETLDRIDAAVERLAEGRWPSWTMEVTGVRLAFHIELAQASADEACSGIAEAVRLAGEDIAWSAELTRDGRPLTSCGTLDLVARERQAGTPDTRS